MSEEKLKIGVSACLMGDEVRYNGGHCRQRYVTDTLSNYADFEKVCPEAAIGMGIWHFITHRENQAACVL